MNISRAVSFIVRQQPPLSEMLARGLANYAAVAAAILPDVERHIGSEASQQAVVMALRRLAERLTLQDASSFDFHSEIIMKSPLCDIAVEWSPQLAGILRELYRAVDIKQGDTLHLIHGNYEVSIITNEKHKGMMLKQLAGHRIINVETSLVALSLRFGKEFMHTPGVIAQVMRELAWNAINVFEIVSTYTELILIVADRDATRGYSVLTGLVRRVAAQ